MFMVHCLHAIRNIIWIVGFFSQSKRASWRNIVKFRRTVIWRSKFIDLKRFARRKLTQKEIKYLQRIVVYMKKNYNNTEEIGDVEEKESIGVVKL